MKLGYRLGAMFTARSDVTCMCTHIAIYYTHCITCSVHGMVSMVLILSLIHI